MSLSDHGCLVVAISLSLAACSSQSEPRIYGGETTVEALSAAARSVSTLSEADDGREVTVSGTISRVCQTMGCWFYLADGEALVYIDLEQGGRFTIPIDSRGQRGIVAGVYSADGGDRRIVAQSAAVMP